jgi:outer membrane protein assembly factor BamD (BamD/ComL family)
MRVIRQLIALIFHLIKDMKKVILFSLLLFLLSFSAFAQKQIEPQIQRDPILEADSKANLDVASHYFKLKKAYRASLGRCEEIIAANPDFSKMDEVLFIAGMSSFYLSEGKGKQKLILKTDEEKTKFSPERLREDAINYLTMLKEKFPNSTFIGETEKNLKLLQDKK